MFIAFNYEMRVTRLDIQLFYGVFECISLFNDDIYQVNE